MVIFNKNYTTGNFIKNELDDNFFVAYDIVFYWIIS